MRTLILIQDEKVEHAKTKCALVKEEEELQFVSTELQVLRKQLEREKATFERAYVFMCVHFTIAIQSCSSLLIVVYYCLFSRNNVASFCIVIIKIRTAVPHVEQVKVLYSSIVVLVSSPTKFDYEAV